MRVSAQTISALSCVMLLVAAGPVVRPAAAASAHHAAAPPRAKAVTAHADVVKTGSRGNPKLIQPETVRPSASSRKAVAIPAHERTGLVPRAHGRGHEAEPAPALRRVSQPVAKHGMPEKSASRDMSVRSHGRLTEHEGPLPSRTARNVPAHVMAETPDPEPSAESTGPLTHHNRKIHLAPEPQPAAEHPRKATRQDFLTAFAPAPALPSPVVPVSRSRPAPVVRTAVDSVVMLHPVAPADVASGTPPPAKLTPVQSVAMMDMMRVPAEPEPVLYDGRGRLLMPAALKGSHEVLVHQNTMADADGLERIQDDDDLDRMRRAGGLVALPSMAGLTIDDRLPLNRRYCRPWAAQFLTALARAHYSRFHSSLQVNSAVRTVAFQHQLQHINGNAAPAEGETASPHLTGQAVDLAKKELSPAEVAWMRMYLLPLMQSGKIDVEEEFQQACFHVSVYRRYAPPVPARNFAAVHRGADTVLADAVAGIDR